MVVNCAFLGVEKATDGGRNLFLQSSRDLGILAPLVSLQVRGALVGCRLDDLDVVLNRAMPSNR